MSGELSDSKIICVCVCVCVQKERERERKRDRIMEVPSREVFSALDKKFCP